MTDFTSTGFRDKLWTQDSGRNLLTGGYVRIYGGAVPANADASIGSAILLCTISTNGAGTGLLFNATAFDGSLDKDPASPWYGTIGVTGTASFWRFELAGDSNLLSTTEARIQGVASTSNGSLLLSTTALVSGELLHVDYCTFSFPPG